jgi:hypothetical protein
MRTDLATHAEGWLILRDSIAALMTSGQKRRTRRVGPEHSGYGRLQRLIGMAKI